MKKGERSRSGNDEKEEKEEEQEAAYECGTRAQWDLREERSRGESESGELIVARAADEAAAIRGPDLWALAYISPRGHTRACACVDRRLAPSGQLVLLLVRSFSLGRSATEVATARCDRAEMSWWWWW